MKISFCSYFVCTFKGVDIHISIFDVIRFFGKNIWFKEVCNLITINMFMLLNLMF